jgi:hypothetical protein
MKPIGLICLKPTWPSASFEFEDNENGVEHHEYAEQLCEDVLVEPDLFDDDYADLEVDHEDIPGDRRRECLRDLLQGLHSRRQKGGSPAVTTSLSCPWVATPPLSSPELFHSNFFSKRVTESGKKI